MNIKLPYIIIPLALIITIISVSRVYALTGPQTNAPIQSEISTPINNSGEVQIKKGSVVTKGVLGFQKLVNSFAYYPEYYPEDSSWTSALLDNMTDALTYSKGDKGKIISGTGSFVVAPWVFATKVIANRVIVGGSDSQNGGIPPIEPLAALPSSLGDYSFEIKLDGRGIANNSVEGTQAISIYSRDANMCNSYTTVIVDRDLSLATSMQNQSGVDVLARQVRLTDNYPHQNSVVTQGQLTYPYQNSRTTVWATVQVVNGQLQLAPNTQ